MKVNLLISDTFLNQINFLHSVVPRNTEWCAITHYELIEKDGSELFNSSNVKIKMLNLYPMDIGSHSYTEATKKELLKKYKDILTFFKPDRFDDYLNVSNVLTGFIHTHHDMGAFFSPTDMSELVTNSSNYEYYLSIVVDYAHKYVAKLMYNIKEEVSMNLPVIRKLSKRYFGNTLLSENTENLDANLVKKTNINSVECDCSIEFENNWKDVFDKRLEAIIESKEATKSHTWFGMKQPANFNFKQNKLESKPKKICKKCGSQLHIGLNDIPICYMCEKVSTLNDSYAINKPIETFDLENILFLLLTNKEANSIASFRRKNKLVSVEEFENALLEQLCLVDSHIDNYLNSNEELETADVLIVFNMLLVKYKIGEGYCNVVNKIDSEVYG